MLSALDNPHRLRIIAALTSGGRNYVSQLAREIGISRPLLFPLILTHGYPDSFYRFLESRFSKDELLTQVMIYWASESIGTSFLPYYDYANAGALTWMKEGMKNWIGSSKLPTAFALFPKDISQPPREWAERFFNVQR